MARAGRTATEALLEQAQAVRGWLETLPADSSTRPSVAPGRAVGDVIRDINALLTTVDERHSRRITGSGRPHRDHDHRPDRVRRRPEPLTSRTRPDSVAPGGSRPLHPDARRRSCRRAIPAGRSRSGSRRTRPCSARWAIPARPTPAAPRRTWSRPTRSRFCGWRPAGSAGPRRWRPERCTPPASAPICRPRSRSGPESASEDGQHPGQFHRRDLAAVLLELGPLVAQEEVEDVLAEGLGDQIRPLHQADGLVQVPGQR